MTTITKQSTFNKTLTKELTLFTSDSITDNMKSVFSELLTDYDKGDILNIVDSLLLYENKTSGDITDVFNEIADSHVDIYHIRRFEWLTEDFSRQYLVNDAINEYGLDEKEFDISDAIAKGQYHYYYNILNSIYYVIEKKIGA